MKRVAVVLAGLILSFPTIAVAAPVVFEASGANAADIQSAVDGFRTFLGVLNPNVPGSFPDGRREIKLGRRTRCLLRSEQLASQLL
jgi:hypothetical protein